MAIAVIINNRTGVLLKIIKVSVNPDRKIKLIKPEPSNFKLFL